MHTQRRTNTTRKSNRHIWRFRLKYPIFPEMTWRCAVASTYACMRIYVADFHVFIGGWDTATLYIVFVYTTSKIWNYTYSGKIKRLRLDDFMIMFLNCNYRFYISSTGILVFFSSFSSQYGAYTNISVNTRLRITFMSTFYAHYYENAGCGMIFLLDYLRLISQLNGGK